MYTTDPGTQDGVSIWHRRQSPTPRGRSMRRRRTWTHSSTEGRSKGAHAVEFSKTVAPLQEGCSFPGRARENIRSRGGPVSIAPGPPRGEGPSPAGPSSITARGCASSAAPFAPSDGCSCVGRRSGELERPIAGTTGGRAGRAEPHLGQHLHRHRPPARTVVEVDQHDLLPGSERQVPVDDRDRLRGTD
jgi:hypothetical protein